MKQREELKDLRAMDADKLESELNAAREELMRLKLRHASGQLEQTAKLRTLRTRIARIRTVQQQAAQDQA